MLVQRMPRSPGLVCVKKRASCSTDRNMAVRFKRLQSLVYVGCWHVVNNIASGCMATGDIPVPKQNQDTNNRITYACHFISVGQTVVRCTEITAIDQVNRRHDLCLVFLVTPRSPFAPSSPTRPHAPPPRAVETSRAHFPSHKFDRSLCLAHLSSRSSLTLQLHPHPHRRPASSTGHPLICCSSHRASSTKRRLVPASARSLVSTKRVCKQCFSETNEKVG